MTLQVTSAHNESRLNGTLSYLAMGSGTAKIKVYSGARPALNGTPAGTLLVEILLNNSIGSIASGLLTLSPQGDALIAASGTAAWARVTNRNGDTAFDCDVSVTGGAGEVQLPGLALYAGGLTRLTSGILG